MVALSLVAAAVRHLNTKPNITTLLGSSPNYKSFIFQWKSYEQWDGTGKAAIVLSQRPWEAPGQYHTRHHWRLQVEIFSDVSRKPDHNPAAQDATDKALSIFEVVDKEFHRVDGGFYLDTLRIHSSERLSEPDISDVPLSDYGVRALVSYGAIID